MKEHIVRWNTTRKKWHQQAHKNEQRFIESANILSTIFKKFVQKMLININFDKL